MRIQLSMIGVAETRLAFAELNAAAAAERDWAVVTVVKYAFFLNAGTRYIRAKRFWEKGVRNVRAGFLTTGTQTRLPSGRFAAFGGRPAVTEVGRSWQRFFGPPGLTGRNALRAEAAIKNEIVRQGLVDTTNLHGSITAAPSVQEAVAESRRRLLLPASAVE